MTRMRRMRRISRRRRISRTSLDFVSANLLNPRHPRCSGFAMPNYGMDARASAQNIAGLI